MINDIDPATVAYWIANGMEEKRYDYDLEPDDLVVDLGSYNGEFATKLHAKYNCRVICVEPTAASNHLEYQPWASVINAAASTDDMPLKFGGAYYYTSALEPGDTEYPCFDILKLLDTDIALMKINIEGLEYPVLKRIIDSGYADLIKYFQIQFHKVNIRSELDYANIAATLMRTHKLDWRVPFCWESWSRK